MGSVITAFEASSIIASSVRTSLGSSGAVTRPCIVRKTPPGSKYSSTSGLSPRGHLERQAEFQDRKSTRLNSSHQKISYAVFCLKKKKKTEKERAKRKYTK